jgi:hypothetical protein
MPLKLPKPLSDRQRRQQARQQADAWYQAAIGALPTVTSINEGATRQQGHVRGMAQGLSDLLRGSQTAVATAAGAAPGVVMQAAQDAAGPMNTAIAGAGAGAPQQNVGAADGRFAALIGANSANALAGLAPAAIARGNFEAGRVQADASSRIAERGKLAAELSATREDRFQQRLAELLEQDLQQRGAVDQSNLAWSTLAYNEDKAAMDARLREFGIVTDARTDAARMAQQQAQHEDRIGIDQQRIAAEWARIDAQIKRDRAAAGGKPNVKKERATIISGARQLANELRTETAERGGTPDSQRVRAKRWSVVVRWNVEEKNALGDVVVKPVNKTIEVEGQDWNQVRQQVENAYPPSHFQDRSYSPLGEPVPIYEDVAGTPGTKGNRYSPRQVFDSVYQYLVTAGFPPVDAKRVAGSLVPGGRPAKAGKPRRGGRPTHL